MTTRGTRRVRTARGLGASGYWQSWLGPVAVVLFCSVVPVSQNYANRAWFDTIGPFDFYAYLIQHDSVLPAVLPLVATLPYALAFSGMLRNRFLTYTRVRRGLRATLAGHLARNAVITFTVFLVVGVIPQLFVIWGQPHYAPEGYGLDTPEALLAAQLRWKTFSQLLSYGPWAPVLAYSAWLALNATLYATVAMCTLLLARNRVLGLSLPWIGYLLVVFGAAVLWLEAYSVALAFPFNLTQMPLVNLSYPITGLGLATAALVAVVLAKAPTLAQLQ